MNEFEAYEILKPTIPEWFSLVGAQECDRFYSFVFRNVNAKSAGCCKVVYKETGGIGQMPFVCMQGMPIRDLDISKF